MFVLIKLFFTAQLLALSAWCCAQSVVVNMLDKSHKPVANTVISLHGDHLPTPKPMTVELIQEALKFSDQHLVVTQGSDIQFLNKDDITHHVYSFSKTWRKQFRLKQDQVAMHTFNKAGKVVLGCNIHDWMLGYIYILDTDLFMLTGKDGIVRFNNVPPGTYTLVAQNPRFKDGRGRLEQEVVVPSMVNGQSSLPKEITLSLKKRLLPARNQTPNLDQYL